MKLSSRMRRLPLTLRLPLAVAALMVVISALISERVLDRLARNQEAYLQGLAGAYMDGLIASITPSVLREDSWEIFDAIERMSPGANAMRALETVVVGRDGLVLAASDPILREILLPLDPKFSDSFHGREVFIDERVGHGFAHREITDHRQTIGTVYTVFDVGAMLQERRQLQVTLFGTNALVTALLALVGFVMVRRMIRPLQVLENHMVKAVSGGARLIEEESFPAGNREAVRLFQAYNGLVRAEGERQQLATQLAHEEKLASLGRLASGMAHEINNPLGGLMNAVDTLRSHGHRQDVRESSLELIERGLVGIREVVAAALGTYRPERLSRSLTNQDFLDMSLLVRPELRRRGQGIDCALADIPASLDGLAAGPVRQAVLNLLLNASSVTTSGGRIRLETCLDGEQLIVRVADQGSGMPSSAIDMLCSPEAGAVPMDQHGLGLWVVRQIVDELGASIQVDRKMPVGTVVAMTIPSRPAEATHAA